MYLGRAANLLLPHHGLSGPISAEHLRSRASSGSSQVTARRGPLKADHSLPTPRSANDREIEDINRQAAQASQRQSRARARAPRRPPSAQLHPTCSADLTDDTDPRGSPGVTSPDSAPQQLRERCCRRRRRHRRVYLIRRPHRAPVYGRITPVSGRERNWATSPDGRSGVAGTETPEAPDLRGDGAPSAEDGGGFLRQGSDAGSPAAQGVASPVPVQGKRSDRWRSVEGIVENTRTSGGSPAEHDPVDSDRTLSGWASPVPFAEGGERRLGEQSVHVVGLRGQCLSETSDSDRDGDSANRARAPGCVCPEEPSSGNLCSLCKRQATVLTERDDVDSLRSDNTLGDDQHTERHPSPPALPAHGGSVTVTDSTSESATPSLVHTRSRQSLTAGELYKQHSLEEGSASKFGVAESKEVSRPVSVHSVPEGSSLPDSEAQDSQFLCHTLPSAHASRARVSEESESDSQHRNPPAYSEFPSAQHSPPQPQPLSLKPVISTVPRSSTVPPRRDSSTLPSNRDSYTLPSKRDSSTLPSKRDSSALPSRRYSSTLPSGTDASALTLRTDSSSLPSIADSSTLTSSREDFRASPSLQYNHAAYGSLNRLHAVLNTQTVSSPRKSKNKNNLFQRWFSTKKGKYFPGNETVPFIETPLEFSRHTQSSRSLKCTESAIPNEENSKLWKEYTDRPSLNINNNYSRQQDFVSNRVSACVGGGPLNRMEKPQEGRSDMASTGKDQTTTESAPQSQRSADSQSSPSEASESSGKVLSLLSSKVVKGGSPGAYENTTVSFNTNVTRREVITIEGSSHAAEARSILLNDSGLPEDLAHTLKATPVMVRERKVSSGSSQGEGVLTTFTGQSSESSASLSMVQLDCQGRLSPRQASKADDELLSTASRIVHAQRSEGSLDDPTDDDHELVVIREYVFAARKTSADGRAAKETVSSEVVTTLSSSVTAQSDQVPAEDSRRNLQSATSPVKEHDSGLDSPPSLQECLLPPVKPKRGGRASRELKEEEVSALKTAPHQGAEDWGKMPGSTEHAVSEPEPAAAQLTSGEFGEASDNDGHLTPAAFVNKLFDQGQEQRADSAAGWAESVPTSETYLPRKEASKPSVQARWTSSDQRPSQERNGDLAASASAVAGSEGQPEVSASAEENDMYPYSLPDKTKKQGAKEDLGKPAVRAALTSAQPGRVGVDRHNADGASRGVAHDASAIIDEEMDAASVSILLSAAPPQSAVKREEDTGIPHTKEDNPALPDRLSRFRDSLAEEDYNKPWESNFLSLEDNIRSKITLAFPSADEKDELEPKAQGETNPSRTVSTSLESAWEESPGKESTGKPEAKDKGSTEKSMSAAVDTRAKEAGEASAPDHSKPAPQAATSVEVHVTPPDDAAPSKQITQDTAVASASASPTLKPVSSPRKTSGQFERPLLPQPPPPPPGAKVSNVELKHSPLEAKVTKAELKPEKPQKTGADGKGSPLHHRKLKEKFKKVFSHSSEDKKAAKAEQQKKTTQVVKKKDTGAPKEEEHKAPNGEEGKPEKEHIYSKPDETKTKPVDGDKARHAAGHDSTEDTDAPESDYLSPSVVTTRRHSMEDGQGSSPQDADPLVYTSIDHEVKLPFSPKLARKIMKAEKKNAGKFQAEEGKDYPSIDESRSDSSKAPNKALKWIKEKLATKGKKMPQSKRYHISGPDELELDEEDVSSKGTKSPAPSDINSASEESIDSSQSSSDGDDDDEEKIKSARKTPFWGGRKDKKKKKKKKSAQPESDSESSSEESKFKLFSWSLGRKKTADSSDHEDNLPSGYNNSTDWTPSEDSAGVSGTFRKLSDDVPQKQNKDQVNPSAGMDTGGHLAKEKEGGVELTVTGVPTDRKGVADVKPNSKLSPDSEDAVKDSSKPAENAAAPSKSASRDGPELSVCDPAQTKWVSLDDFGEPQSKTAHEGDEAKLRDDATAEKNSKRLWKQQKNTDYVFTRPKFLEDDTIVDSTSKGEDRREVLASPPHKNGSGNGTEGREPNIMSAVTQDTITEDKIVPIQASRPVVQALGSLDKVPRQERNKGKQQESQPPSSPVLEVKPKRVTFAGPQPQPKPKQTKTEAEEAPAVEEDIVPSTGEDAFRGHSLNRRSDSKPKPPSRQGGSGDTSSSVKVEGQPGVALDPDVGGDCGQLPSGGRTTLLTTELTVHTRSAATDSPRSNASSDDSEGRTYLDKPGFLDVAKAHWNLQDGKPSKDAPAKPGLSKPGLPKSQGKQQVAAAVGPSNAVSNKTDTTAPGSVSGVTGKLSGNQSTETDRTQPSGSQGDTPDPEDPEPYSVYGTVFCSKSGPGSSPTGVQAPGKFADILKKFGPSSEPHAAVKKTASGDAGSLPSSPSSNRRMTRAVTPAELKSARQDAASGSGQTNVGKTTSPTLGSKDAPIDWLDSFGGKSALNVPKRRPDKPSPVAPKPSVSPLISPKPKATVSEEGTEPQVTELKQGVSSRELTEETLVSAASRQVQCQVKGSVNVTPGAQTTKEEPNSAASKPAVRQKPAPPSKPVEAAAASDVSKPSMPAKPAAVSDVSKPSNPAKPAAVSDVSNPAKPAAISDVSKPSNPAKPAAVSDVSKPSNPAKHAAVSEVSKVISTPSNKGSPEPKPRKRVQDNRVDTAEERPAHQPGALPAQHTARAEEASTLLSKPTTDGSHIESLADASTSSWGGKTDSTMGPPVGDFTLALDSGKQHSTGSSTSTWGESSESTLDPHNAGDFTIGLELRDKEKTVPPQGVTGLTPPESPHKGDDAASLASSEHDVGSFDPTQNESDFTNVTVLTRSQMSSRFTPLSQSTPLTSKLASTPSSSSTLGDVTVSSVSTFSDPGSESDAVTKQHDLEEIYEPIFFEDLHDPRSSRLTEAPPVRPEKVRKRRTEGPPRIVYSEYQNDRDSMYDVPRNQHTFAFPKESSMPVLSIVDKRNSKTSLRGMMSLEPEDSITPYATCHRAGQMVKQASDYEDDENPYMNDDEDFHVVSSAQSQPAEKPDVCADTEEEAVHASLKELFPEVSKHGAAMEDASASEEPKSKDVHQTESGGVSEPDKSNIHVKKMFQIGSSSSDTSSHRTSSSSSPDEETGAPSKNESSKGRQELKPMNPDDVRTVEAKPETEDRPREDEEDQYLKSPEYKRSVDEINKLYAALEKEELEMESQSAASEPQTADGSTKTPIGRLLSFEEQRAELKPLRKEERNPPDQTATPAAEEQIAAEPLKTTLHNSYNSSSSNSNSKSQEKPSNRKETKPVSNPFAKKNPAPKASSGSTTSSKQGSNTSNTPQSSPPAGKRRKPPRRPGPEPTPGSAQEGVHPEKGPGEHGKESSHSHDSAFHRLKGFLKPGVKRSKSQAYDEPKGKVAPAEGKRKAQGGGKETVGGHGQDSKGVHGLSTFHVELPADPSSPEVEMTQHHPMYAQVFKNSAAASLDAAQPAAADPPEPEPDPKRKEASPSPSSCPSPESSPSTAKKLSILSTFFVSKGKTSSPGPQSRTCDTSQSKGDVSPKTTVRGTATPTVESKAAAVVASAPPVASQKVPPEKGAGVPERDTEKLTGGANLANAFAVSAKISDPMSSEKAPALKSQAPSSKEPVASKLEISASSTKTGASKPGGSKKAPEKPEKPKPPQKPPGETTSTLPDQAGAIPLPKPRDLSRTYSDVITFAAPLGSDANTKLKEPSGSGANTKLEIPAISVARPGGSSEKPEQQGAEDGPVVPTRHSSLSADLAVPGQDPAAEPSKGLPDIPHGRRKKRLRVPGAGAATESEDSEEEEEEEDTEESDGDSPPLPERKYREIQSKYNEYSNVIRVDSTRLKEARVRSLSRPLLTEDLPDKKDKGNTGVSRIRKAFSLEGGLDKKGKKGKGASGEENGELGEKTKTKKPFFTRPFKDLFGGKKKKGKRERRRRRSGGGGEEGGEEGEGEEENVYEDVDDSLPDPRSKSKKSKSPGSPTSTSTATKHTWPKLKKRKKASHDNDHDPDNDHAHAERSSSDHDQQQQQQNHHHHHQHQPLRAVNSSHDSKDVRPIGRLLQLNPDGTQLLELIRPPNGQLGVQLTQGNEETLQGKFVSGFVDKSTQKLLSGILHEGDQILKINDRPIDDCPLLEVHDIIDTHQRLKFLVFPGDNH